MCIIIKKNFRLDLNEHMDQLQCDQYYDDECHWCDAPLAAQKKDMVIHVAEYHPSVERIKCKDCSRKYDHSKYMWQHWRKCHNGPRPFGCSYCNMTFRNKERVHVHQLTHTGERPYVCEHCGKGFIQLAHLYTHLNMHKRTHKQSKSKNNPEDKQILHCQLCSKFQSSSFYVLSNHLKDKHGDDGLEVYQYMRSLYCHKCNLFFESTTERDDHLRAHLPFECVHCNKYFGNADTLASHMRMHTNTIHVDRPFECDVCFDFFFLCFIYYFYSF